MDLERRRGDSPIRSIFCCNDCIRPGNQSSNFELGQIYLGDHLTRSWNRPIKVPPTSGHTATSQQTNKPRLNGPEDVAKAASIRRSSRKKRIKTAREFLNIFHITNADLEMWNTSFDSLLKSEAGRCIFKNFLETEFAEENLNFWLACENLKATLPHQSRKMEKHIQDIFDTYISTHSVNEVNIDYKMRENIVAKMKSHDVDIFTDAQHQIYSLMYRDSYPRFLISTFIVDLMEEVNALEQSKPDAGLKPRRETPYFCCVKRQDSMRGSQTTFRNDVVEVKPTSVSGTNDVEEAATTHFSKTQRSENTDSSRNKLPSEPPPFRQSSSKKPNGYAKSSSTSKDKLISSREAPTICDTSFSN